MRSKQSGLKREKEKGKQKKKQEKEEKRLERKNNSNKGKGFDAMIAYVDERGNFSDTPPDPSKREELKLEDIQLGAYIEKEPATPAAPKQGRISYYNEQKGYGFIKDEVTKGTVFFHVSSVSWPITLNELVFYETVRGPKGMTADNIARAE